MTVHPMDEREAVRGIFPKLSETELSQAVLRLREYFQIAADISARELKNSTRSVVDSPESSSTMRERSNDSLKT